MPVPKSDNSDLNENSLKKLHTSPVVNQKRLIQSHRPLERKNVAQYIKDHALGRRQGLGSKYKDTKS